jgi:carbon monoxide dehydrogenase subunit G
MKVKVGPVTMEFKGKATLTEIDEAGRRVTIVGTGNDKGGSGSARMEMASRVVEAGDGGSEIVVVADVDLAGKIVRFGRGMMEGVSKQLFKQFAERVREALAVEEAPKVEAPPQAEEPPKTEEPQKVEEPAKVEEPPRVEEPEAEEPPKVEAPKKAAPLAPAESEALDAGRLFWTVVWEWLKRLFRRLFG